MTNKLVVGISLLLSAFLFSCNTVLPKPSDLTLAPASVTANVNATVPDPAAVLSFTNSGSIAATYTLSVATPNATSIKLTGANALGTISGVVAPKAKASVNVIGAKCPAAPGTYTSTIQGQDATTTVKFSNTFTLVCVALPPAAPASFTATLNGSSVNLSWPAVIGAISYNIERKTGTGAYAALTTQTGASYTDATTQAGNTYTYRIQSVNAGGVSAWVESAAVTVPVPAPAAPAIITAVVSGSAVSVSWPAATGAITYELQRSVDGGVFSATATQTGLTYSDPTTVAGNSYKYQVRAVNSGGASAWVQSATVTLAAPTNLVATLNGNTVGLTWSAVTNATSYIVERKVGTGAFSALVSVTSPSYTDASVLPSNTYTYRVQAANGKLVSAWIESNSVTTSSPTAIFESLTPNPLELSGQAAQGGNIDGVLTVKNSASATADLTVTSVTSDNPNSKFTFTLPAAITPNSTSTIGVRTNCVSNAGIYQENITVVTSDPNSATNTKTSVVRLTCAKLKNFRIGVLSPRNAGAGETFGGVPVVGGCGLSLPYTIYFSFPKQISSTGTDKYVELRGGTNAQAIGYKENFTGFPCTGPNGLVNNGFLFAAQSILNQDGGGALLKDSSTINNNIKPNVVLANYRYFDHYGTIGVDSETFNAGWYDDYSGQNLAPEPCGTAVYFSGAFIPPNAVTNVYYACVLVDIISY